jgi:hypothetical protein
MAARSPIWAMASGPSSGQWVQGRSSGSLACGVGDTDTLALPGTLVHVPGGSVHWFKFGKDGGVMMSMTSLGNASKMFTDFDREGSWDNPDRAKLIALAAKHGQVVVPTTN